MGFLYSYFQSSRGLLFFLPFFLSFFSFFFPSFLPSPPPFASPPPPPPLSFLFFPPPLFLPCFSLFPLAFPFLSYLYGISHYCLPPFIPIPHSLLFSSPLTSPLPLPSNLFNSFASLRILLPLKDFPASHNLSLLPSFHYFIPNHPRFQILKEGGMWGTGK